jgi:uncharacterized glyoxalase superfamily protein PhnB
MKRTFAALLLFSVLTGTLAARPPQSRKESTMHAASSATPTIQHLAPVLIVESVEPGIEFWSKRFGFAVENQVPGPDGKLVFASVKKGGVEIMYQTRASVIADQPESAKDLDGRSVALFLTVSDLDAVEKAVEGVPVVKPRHKTFYGSTELYVREPGGNVVGFAQMP